jgi:phosphatidylcholine synthase
MPEPADHTDTSATTSATSHSPARIGLAWGVHLFTALGAVLAAIALVAIGEGDFRTAAILMLATLVIDSADGTMARAVGVKEVLPNFDGRRLDDIIDFLNYVIVPVVFMLAAGSLPHWSVGVLPILASCYGFSQVAAKTEDNFFLGFPSYWNFVALYAWGLGASPLIATIVVVVLSILVFVPFKYAYPSMLPPRQRWFNAAVGILWTAVFTACLIAPERVARFHLLGLSLAYPIYYFILSWWLVRRSESKS